MASKSMQPAASAEELTVVMTLEGHEQPISHDEDHYYRRNPVTISYVPGGEQMISGSGDKTARKWDLQTGKEVHEARVVCEEEVTAVAVSRDGRWLITGTERDDDDPADVELRSWEIKTGIMKTFKGHSLRVTCIDISADSKLLASGSGDGTARIWDLDTSKLVAGPFRSLQAHWGGTVRFSQDSKKLAVKSCVGKCLEVWDIQGQKLDRRIGKQRAGGQVAYAPVFWTTNDKSIVAGFTFTPMDKAKTIYEFDPSTLDTVGVPFQGHTEVIASLALSSDCALLASASYDHTIKLWAFGSRQLLASFDIEDPRALILSPDLRHFAYTTLSDSKIYICNVPPNILASIRSAQDAKSASSAPNTPPLGDRLNSDATRRPDTVRPAPVISFTPLPHRPSPTVHQQQPAFLRTLRKFIPSFYRNALPQVGNGGCPDPLDFPATSSSPMNHSLLAQTVIHVRPGMHSGENSRPAAIAQPSATIKARLSGWWPIHTGRAPPPIVDVPLAQGKKRNAAAGASKGSDDLVLDENFDSRPPSPNPNSQLPSAAAQTNSGVHGNSWSCFCL